MHINHLNSMTEHGRSCIMICGDFNEHSGRKEEENKKQWGLWAIYGWEKFGPDQWWEEVTNNCTHREHISTRSNTVPQDLELTTHQGWKVQGDRLYSNFNEGLWGKGCVSEDKQRVGFLIHLDEIKYIIWVKKKKREFETFYLIRKRHLGWCN